MVVPCLSSTRKAAVAASSWAPQDAVVAVCPASPRVCGRTWLSVSAGHHSDGRLFLEPELRIEELVELFGHR